MADLAIARVEAIGCSVPLRQSVQQGLGQAVKRDTVIVRVTTADGLMGYGESYNGRAPLAVVQTVNTTLADLVKGMDATATSEIWQLFENRVLANHGTCAACVCAMSGIDMALWDIRGKAAGQPLYRLLGGSSRPVPAYAGGFSLGYAETAAVAGEAVRYVREGFRAVKQRLGDTLQRDLERTVAMRSAVGDGSKFSRTPTAGTHSTTCARRCPCWPKRRLAGWRSRSRRTGTGSTAPRHGSRGCRWRRARTATRGMTSAG